jgi:hypothetical protein
MGMPILAWCLRHQYHVTRFYLRKPHDKLVPLEIDIIEAFELSEPKANDMQA